MTDITALRALTRLVLDDPGKHKWTIQGFGLLRLYLPGEARLHIWDHSRGWPHVTMIHDHVQWGLHSTVVCGELTNTRYLEVAAGGATYNFMKILAGIGGGPISETGVIRLDQQPAEIYRPGDTYSQEPLEVHETRAMAGTVTVMQKFPSPDGKTARVFWPIDQDWGDAVPRVATWDEIVHFVALAQQQMDAQK